MNVVGYLSPQKHVMIKYFIFAINLFWFVLNIVTLLLEFAPCCQLHLSHHARRVGVAPDYVVKNLPREKKKKCMTSEQEKSLLVCVWSSLSACPLVFCLPFFSPHIPSSLQQS